MKKNTKYNLAYKIIAVSLFAFVFMFAISKVDFSSIMTSSNLFGDEETIDVQFDDKNLYTAIVNRLSGSRMEKNELELSFTISKSNVESITSLKLNNSGITSLRGIEKFTNLRELDISNNRIEDISYLSQLTKLQKLVAYSNNIKDITPLADLVNITKLDLSRNVLQDTDVVNNIEILSNLVRLEELDLSRNLLINTTGLNNFPGLIKLDLYDNNIANLEGLENLTSLQVLNLGENTKDAEGLDKLKTLTHLTNFYYQENDQADIIDYIKDLNLLEVVDLSDNGIESIENIESLTKLKKLILYNNELQDISSVFSLQNLEELVVAYNKIPNLNGFVNSSSQLTLPKLKVLNVFGNWSIGYSNSDKNALTVLNNMHKDRTLEFYCNRSNSSDYRMHVDSDGKSYVTYEDFGALGDGRDDSYAMYLAHQYCNATAECSYVRATLSTYNIFGYYTGIINVKKSVDWNNAKFVIHDEEIENYGRKLEPIFFFNNIDQNTKKIVIENPSITIEKTTKKLSILVPEISEYTDEGYERFYVKIINENKKQYITSGSEGEAQNDVVIMDKDGNLLNDIQWDFDSVTSIEIYAIPKSKFYIKNATFTYKTYKSLSDINYERCSIDSSKPCYYYRNLEGNLLANVEVNNLNFSFENDEITGSSIGYINFSNTADIKFKGVKMHARKYNIPRSTYGINLEYGVNVNFENIESTPFGSDFNKRSGIMRTAYLKDATFNNVKLNSIDSHQGVYNMTVKNSLVGNLGFTLTGQGTLLIENTTITAPQMISFRSDYGSTWNGDIYLNNVTFKPIDTKMPRLFDYSLTYDENGNLHNFGYTSHLPNIYINNLTIDNTYNNYVNNVSLFQNDIVDPNSVEDVSGYWPSNVIINGYKFVNSTFDDDYLQLTGYEFDQMKERTNALLESIKITANNKDITDKLDKENIVLESDVSLYLKDLNEVTNYYEIYRNDEIEVEKTELNRDLTKTFTRNGNYKIVVSMTKNVYDYTGQKEYSFTIKRNNIYSITNGNRQVFDSANPESKTFTVSGKELYLIDVQINDVSIDESNYIVDENGSSITLLADFLNGLSAGTYRVKFAYENGYAIGNFSVIRSVFTPPETVVDNTPIEQVNVVDNDNSLNSGIVNDTGGTVFDLSNNEVTYLMDSEGRRFIIDQNGNSIPEDVYMDENKRNQYANNGTGLSNNAIDPNSQSLSGQVKYFLDGVEVASEPTGNVVINADKTTIYERHYDSIAVVTNGPRTYFFGSEADMNLETNGDIKKLTGVIVDDLPLTSRDFKIKEDKIVILADFLDKLKIGKHTIAFTFEDGYVTKNASFDVKLRQEGGEIEVENVEKNNGTDKDAIATSVNKGKGGFNPYLLIIPVLALFGIFGIKAYNDKQNKKKEEATDTNQSAQ